MKRIQVVLLLFAIVPMFAITKAIAGNNNQFIMEPVIRIYRYGNICRTENPVFLKIPTIRENFALTSSVRTMSASAVIAGRTSECGRHP